MRTLVSSTDPAHSLADSLGVELATEPRPAGDLLWGQEVRAQEQMERQWSAVQDWLGELFLERGLDRISAGELTVPPGMDELFSLLALAPSTNGRLGRDHPRPRAHRRDARAAVIPRRRALVDRAGVPDRASDSRGGTSSGPVAT